MNPYRLPAPKSPRPPIAPERREDAFGYFFWFVVAVLGLAVANGAGSTAGPPPAYERAR